MIRYILASCAATLLFAGSAAAQPTSFEQYNQRKDQISKRSMYALGGWGVANFAVSGAMVGFASGEAKYFHQMNIYWNLVNVGLAGVGLLGSKGSGNLSPLETLKAQHSTEKIYLLNTGLDVGYIFGGLYLAELGNRFPDRHDQFKGFGKSIVVQGSFLLVLDLVMYFVHKGHRTKALSPLLENIDLGLTGFRMRF